jgi:hypothetical protein
VHAVAERLLQTGEYRTDCHAAEALAYSLVLARDYDGAKEILKLLRRITLEDDEQAAWWAHNGRLGDRGR